jgi:hypothetical protein
MLSCAGDKNKCYCERKDGAKHLQTSRKDYSPCGCHNPFHTQCGIMFLVMGNHIFNCVHWCCEDKGRCKADRSDNKFFPPKEKYHWKPNDY